MRALYIDCKAGISADMLLKALVDMGVDSLMKMEEADINDHEHEEDHDHNHDHGHDHNHKHEDKHDHDHCSLDHIEHSCRSYNDILEIIENAPISARAKESAKNIYRIIAEAEAEVHGETLDTVHFHEVGRMEAIMNILSIAAYIDGLEIKDVICSEIHDGHGSIQCSHGTVPVPVPAVSAMMKKSDLKFEETDIETELVTPTGLGILLGLNARHGAPTGNIIAAGTGYGGRETGLGGLKAFLTEL